MHAVKRLGTRFPAVFLIAAAMLVLFPPRVLEGRYSTLEVSLALLAGSLMLSLRSEQKRSLVVAPAVLLLLALMLASTLWSSASWTTLRDSLAYVALAAAATLIARVSSIPVITSGIAIGGLIALIASLLAALVDPADALDKWIHSLNGIYSNRNGLGYVLVQTVPAVLVIPLKFRFALVVRLGLVAALGAGVWATTSRTALITFAAIVVAWAALSLIRRIRWAAIPIVAIALSVAGLALFNIDRVLSVLGKDATGTGRTAIWERVLQLVAERPLVGFGWSNSWPPGSPQMDAMISEFGQPFFHAHNETLNWLVTLGGLGVIAVLTVFVTLAFAGWREFTLRTPASGWLLLTGVMMLVRGLTEISETSAQGWFVLMLAVAAGSYATHQRQSGGKSRLFALPVGVGRPSNSGQTDQ